MKSHFLIFLDDINAKDDVCDYLKGFDGVEIVESDKNVVVIIAEYMLKDTIFKSFPLLENDLGTALTVLAAHQAGNTEKYILNKIAKARRNHLYTLTEACLIMLSKNDAYLKEMLRIELSSIEYDLAITGKTFVQSTFDIGLTAKTLGTHRNTINYRLKSIKEKYGLDLHLINDATYFLLLLYVADVCA